MSWDNEFNLTWAQRIEKEERSFLGPDSFKEPDVLTISPSGRATPASASGSRSRRRRPHSDSGNSRHDGGTAAHSRPRTSDTAYTGASSSAGAGHERQHTATAPRRSSSTPQIPKKYEAVAAFPCRETNLLVSRPKLTEDGRVPSIRFRKEYAKAMWWPGRGTYTTYVPEFYFKDPPEWDPRDITKPRKQ